jgi:hypothetical protein
MRAVPQEIHHSKGLCLMYVKDYARAIECFKRANSIQRHDVTYMVGRAAVHCGGVCH